MQVLALSELAAIEAVLLSDDISGGGSYRAVSVSLSLLGRTCSMWTGRVNLSAKLFKRALSIVMSLYSGLWLFNQINACLTFSLLIVSGFAFFSNHSFVEGNDLTKMTHIGVLTSSNDGGKIVATAEGL